MSKPEKLICAWCDEPFDRPHKIGTIPLYCKGAHRQAAFRAREKTRIRGETEGFCLVETVDGKRIWWIHIHPEGTMVAAAPLSDPPGKDWLPIYVHPPEPRKT